MNDAINNLREALKISPDNMPLRMLLAETLMNHFQYADAEEVYKSALTLAPSDVKILGWPQLAIANKNFLLPV